jgi:hypothetical protein
VKKVTGWLILESHPPYQAVEFIVEEEPLGEPPYSDDNDILQFHLALDFSAEYPTASIIP